MKVACSALLPAPVADRRASRVELSRRSGPTEWTRPERHDRRRVVRLNRPVVRPGRRSTCPPPDGQDRPPHRNVRTPVPPPSAPRTALTTDRYRSPPLITPPIALRKPQDSPGLPVPTSAPGRNLEPGASKPPRCLRIGSATTGSSPRRHSGPATLRLPAAATPRSRRRPRTPGFGTNKLFDVGCRPTSQRR